MLTRENERVISHWLSARHRRSRMLRGHWPLSCDCLEEEPHSRAKYEGLNTNTCATTFKERENAKALSETQADKYVYIHTQPHMYSQLDGDDDGADTGRTLTAFR